MMRVLKFSIAKITFELHYLVSHLKLPLQLFQFFCVQEFFLTISSRSKGVKWNGCRPSDRPLLIDKIALHDKMALTLVALCRHPTV